MALEMSDRHPGKPPLWLMKINRKVLFLAALAAIVLFAVAALTFVMLNASMASVPRNITDQYKGHIFIPSKLPANYKIDRSSFYLAEDNTVLVFAAKNGVGGNLVFSEQAKPGNINFDEFYKEQMEEPKTLSDTPYVSVWSSSQDRGVLSVVAEDAWLIMTTTTPLGEDDMQAIAQGIKRQ